MDGLVSEQERSSDSDAGSSSEAPSTSGAPTPIQRARRRIDRGTLLRHAGQETRVVAVGNLLTFAATLPAARRQDALDSTLFSQLLAQRAHPRRMDPEAWHGAYQAMLGKVGWRTLRAQVSTWRPESWIFSVEELVVGALVGFTTQEIISSAIAAMTAFDAQEPEAAAIAAYRTAAVSGGSAALQISVMGADARLVSVMVAFATRQQLDQLFTQPLTADQLRGGVSISAQVSSLDLATFAPLRQKVVARLGQRRSQLIVPLDDGTGSLDARAIASW